MVESNTIAQEEVDVVVAAVPRASTGLVMEDEVEPMADAVLGFLNGSGGGRRP